LEPYFCEDGEVKCSTQCVNVEIYIRKKPFKKCIKFGRKFPDVSILSKATIHQMVNRF
jgi:hypothetical protein